MRSNENGGGGSGDGGADGGVDNENVYYTTNELDIIGTLAY
jgi:hypothetical protein